jgi:hypothetical protein
MRAIIVESAAMVYIKGQTLQKLLLKITLRTTISSLKTQNLEFRFIGAKFVGFFAM